MKTDVRPEQFRHYPPDPDGGPSPALKALNQRGKSSRQRFSEVKAEIESLNAAIKDPPTESEVKRLADLTQELQVADYWLQPAGDPPLTPRGNKGVRHWGEVKVLKPTDRLADRPAGTPGPLRRPRRHHSVVESLKLGSQASEARPLREGR